MTRFYLLDVFAERKYAGNQLAVFRDAGNLDAAEMQALAREINYSETTFILADHPAEDQPADEPRDGGWDVRIFTPQQEIPFAGHPTLGTAHVIGREILQGRVERVVLNLAAGRIPVTLSPDGYGWMKQLPPVFGPRHDPATLARILGLDLADLDERYPVEEVSTGLPFFIVPLRGIAALQRARVDRDRYFDLVRRTAAKGMLIFCPQTHEPGNDLSVRVFVDYLGVPEDPATGSGNGCLAGYLVRYRCLGTERIDLRVEQGYEIGRPSLLLLRAGPGEGEIDVSVGGKSIVVARGELATG